MSQERQGSKEQVEEIEHISVNEKRSEEEPKKSWLIRIKDSIYTKPEKSPNVWHLLTNLNNTQRITFVAGKKNYDIYNNSYYC